MTQPNNNISTLPRADVVAARLEADIPLSKYPYRKFENLYGGGTGSVVMIRTVDYGKVIASDNGDMSGIDASTASIQTDVKVRYKTNPVELTNMDLTLNLADFDTQVVKPRISYLASKINEEIIGASIRAASYGIIAPSSDAISFAGLANAAAKVRRSRVDRLIAGAINFDVDAAVTATGNNMFSANNSLGNDLYQGKIRNFAGVDWVPTADCPIIENPQVIAGATLAGPITNGTNVIPMTFTMSGTIPKYTPFSISGINAVDVYGNDMGIARTFVVEEDTNFTAGQTANIPVAPVWTLTTDAGLKNATSLGTVGATATFPLDAITYNVGSAFASKAVAFASVKPAPLKGVKDTAVSNVDGINVLMTAVANAETFTSYIRWDVLTGSKPLYQPGACGIYVPVASN